MQQAFGRLVQAGDVVVDVRTNWGGHALHLSLLVGAGAGGRVIAVEPNEAHVKSNVL